jgi:hypothetical protein
VKDFDSLKEQLKGNKVELDIDTLKQFYGAYLQCPNQSTIIRKLTDRFGLKITNSIYKTVVNTFEEFRKNDYEVKEIVDEISNEV